MGIVIYAQRVEPGMDFPCHSRTVLRLGEGWIIPRNTRYVFSTFVLIVIKEVWGTGIRGLMRGMATLPQGNQELLVVRDKVGRPPRELGVSKSMGCDIFPSLLWHCWLGDRKGIRPVKKLDVGLLMVMIWLELCTTYSSSCHHHFHHPLLH